MSNKFWILALSISVLTTFAYCHEEEYETEEDIAQEVDSKYVTYGSTIRLMNLDTHLHSHSVKYGSGSGQQSVTGFQGNNDYNSLWILKEGQGRNALYHENVVRCGDIIRIEHALTKRNLHSHEIESPISNNQEVSAYGDNGSGDTGDDWKIICINAREGTNMKAMLDFQLLHYESKKYLSMNMDYHFNNRNCPGCPINGQLEVCAESENSEFTKWKIHSGLFFEVNDSIADKHESQEEPDNQAYIDDEL